MNTLSKKVRGFCGRHGRKAAALVTGVGVTVAGAGNAFAGAPADPTGGATDDFADTITGYLTTYGIPAIITVAVAGVGIALVMWFVRKARAATSAGS